GERGCGEGGEGEGGEGRAGAAGEGLRLSRQPRQAVFVGRRETCFALDGLQQDLERRVRCRQNADDLDRLGQVAIADDRDVVDERPPLFAVVLEIKAADRVGGGGRRRRPRGLGSAQGPPLPPPPP